MSRRINVNPDHYKVAGRERQGENIVHEVERREANRLRRNDRRATTRAEVSPQGPRSGQRDDGGSALSAFSRPCRLLRGGAARAARSARGQPLSPDARALMRRGAPRFALQLAGGGARSLRTIARDRPVSRAARGCRTPFRRGLGARRRRGELDAGAARLRQADRDRLFGRSCAVLALANVMDLFAHELTSLRARPICRRVCPVSRASAFPVPAWLQPPTTVVRLALRPPPARARRCRSSSSAASPPSRAGPSATS